MSSQDSQQESPQGNLLLFIALAFLIFLSWYHLRSFLYPTPPEQPAEKGKKGGKASNLPDTIPGQPAPTPDDRIINLGVLDKASAFNLFVRLDPRGAGVRRVTLNKFLESNINGKPTDDPLDLVPEDANRHVPSHLLYHFEDPKDERPVDLLGKVEWKVERTKDGKVVEVSKDDDREVHTVTFSTRAVKGLKITKKFKLRAGDYHIGLEVKAQRLDVNGPAQFRYQLTGAKGLPLDGKWYAHTFQNSLIAVEGDDGRITARDLQDLKKISWKGGGDQVQPGDGFIRYAGVAVQYFASVIAVPDQQDTSILASARPTLEYGVIHGRARGPVVLGQRIEVVGNDGKTTETIFLTKDTEIPDGPVEKGQPVAILYRNLGYDPEMKECPKEALEVRVGADAEGTHALWEDNITVRVNTNTRSFEGKEPLVHNYVLYQGPVKPLLLGYLRGNQKVDQELVKYYTDGLNLKTLVDYQMPGWAGTIFYNTGWTWLVISVTNLVHSLLNMTSWVVPNLGLCIILLTVLVRGIMFPLSRRQALMAIKMQALAPELKKLQEKYKDQSHELTLAQWDLYKKHNVNPIGSCWIIFLQMPIFLGLYYALQESITFRLGEFWPTWITNLSAPDMMIHWGRGIWWISRDADYGSLFYLGPYLNILPLIAVALMLVQQKLMSPPAVDEQQEMQQKMMTWMMAFFALMFYKVAAGLCVYYIVTTLWGFAERAMLPKAETDVQPGTEGTPAVLAPAMPEGPSGAVPQSGKKKSKKKGGKEEEAAPGWAARLTDWWNDLLEQARKK
jgi:YidC/Oxa1 family membrane protein insertase